MPATVEQVQDAILQLEEVTSAAMAKAAAIAQDAAAAGQDAASAPRVKAIQYYASITDKAQKRKAAKLEELKKEGYIDFPDNQSVSDLASIQTVSCASCRHVFVDNTSRVAALVQAISKHIEANGGRGPDFFSSSCKQNKKMLALKHGKSVRVRFAADCSKCGYARTWAHTHAFVKHQKTCTGKAPRCKKGWKKV